ncbi:MAG: hypothetical protein RLZZ387_1927 [Chloroflexota bacterium]|jgi:hypothetical protein
MTNGEINGAPVQSAGSSAARVGLHPSELEPILRRLDADLVRRQDSGDAPAADALMQRIDAIAGLRAPLYQPHGGLLKRTLMRLVNIPLRVFGRPQSYHNAELLHLLRDVAAAYGNMERDQRGQDDWIRLVDRKVLMLARDVREQRAAPAGGAEISEPKILDPEAFRRKLAEMGDQVRVNLGCGEKPLPGYINIDARPLPEVDAIADVRRLPFEPGTLAEIASAHLVEHFREHQLRVVILPYWRSLLCPGGGVRITCPNWEAMMELLRGGQLSFAEYKLLTFGGQDYEGDDHFAMYTPATLRDLLLECGFARVEVVAEARMNSICPEMELLATL